MGLSILLGLAANGLMVLVVQAWFSAEGPSLLFGISPYQIAAILIATYLVNRAEDDALARFGGAEWLALAALLVPSSTVSWAALVLYSGLIAWRGTGQARLGALIFSGLGACALWSSLVMNWLAMPITTAEALIVSNLLSFYSLDVAWNGNVVGLAGGFKLILLPACASADLVPKAMLSLAAIAAICDAPFDRRFALTAVSVGILLSIGNWIRLAIMAISAEHYDFMHGVIGANFFDLYQTALILGAGYLLVEPREGYHETP